jgi:hypothetical protein
VELVELGAGQALDGGVHGGEQAVEGVVVHDQMAR